MRNVRKVVVWWGQKVTGGARMDLGASDDALRLHMEDGYMALAPYKKLLNL